MWTHFCAVLMAQIVKNNYVKVLTALGMYIIKIKPAG